MADNLDAQDFVRIAVSQPANVVATFRSADGTVERHFTLADGTRECEITRPNGAVKRSSLPHKDIESLGPASIESRKRDYSVDTVSDDTPVVIGSLDESLWES